MAWSNYWKVYAAGHEPETVLRWKDSERRRVREYRRSQRARLRAAGGSERSAGPWSDALLELVDRWADECLREHAEDAVALADLQDALCGWLDRAGASDWADRVSSKALGVYLRARGITLVRRACGMVALRCCCAGAAVYGEDA